MLKGHPKSIQTLLHKETIFPTFCNVIETLSLLGGIVITFNKHFHWEIR